MHARYHANMTSQPKKLPAKPAMSRHVDSQKGEDNPLENSLPDSKPNETTANDPPLHEQPESEHIESDVQVADRRDKPVSTVPEEVHTNVEPKNSIVWLILKRLLQVWLTFSLPLVWIQIIVTGIVSLWLLPARSQTPASIHNTTNPQPVNRLSLLDTAIYATRLAFPLPLLIALILDGFIRLGPDWHWPATLYLATLLASAGITLIILINLGMLRSILSRK